MMAAGTIGMPCPGRSVPVEVWDIKAMAAHCHRIVVADDESSGQMMEIKAQMQAVPEGACPPGFRPPPLHKEALLLQSCTPGFRPPVQHVVSSAIMQPRMIFHCGDPITYRPEFCLDSRPGVPVGIHGTVHGSSRYGAADRHGWYPNESSSGVGRVCESHFIYPLVSLPYLLPRESLDKNISNLYLGAELENEKRRRETLLQHGQSLSPSVRVSNVTSPLTSYPEAFCPGNILAITGEARKRGTFEGSDNTSPPFKRLRTGHKVDSPSWARSRLESEMAWSNCIQIGGDRSPNCEATHSSSLHTQKQTDHRNKTKSSNGTMGKQESRTRRSPTHYQSGSLSSRDRHRAPISFEVSQESELRSTPCSIRSIGQGDRSSLRATPRSVYPNGEEQQHGNSSCLDARSRPSNRGSWSPSRSLLSWIPNRRSNYDRRSLRVGECSWRRESWQPQLLAGRSTSGAEADKRIAHWRSADDPCEIEREAEENGSLTTFHTSRVVEENAKDDRRRTDSQFLDVVAKHISQHCGEDGNVAQKANYPLDNMAPASIDRIKNENLPLRAGTIQKLPEMNPKAEQHGSLEKNLPLRRNGSQLSGENAGSSFAKLMTTTAENQSASIQSISATSLKITRYFTSIRPVSKYYTSQNLEVNWKISPDKVITRRRRAVVVSAGPSMAKISGSDEAAALAAEEQDEAAEGEMLLPKETSKSLLAPRLLLKRSSIPSETGINGGCPIKVFVGLPRVSSEVTIQCPSVTHGQVTRVSKVGSFGNEIAGKKWIFTGVRNKHIPSFKLLKTTSGSDLQPPECSGKAQIPRGCLLAEDSPGYLRSQQMEEASSTLTVRNGRVLFHAGVKNLSGNPSVPRSDLSSLDKDQEMCREGQLRSSCRTSVGASRVNPVAGKSGSLLDDWLFGICSSIPLAAETNNGFQPNARTSGSSRVFVKSEPQDLLTSRGDKQSEQLSGFFREKTTSVIELAKVVTDKMKSAVVEGEQDTKVISHSPGLRDASAREGDNLASQPNREDAGQGGSTIKLASFLTNAGASLVTEGTGVMNIVPQLSDLQDLRNPGGKAAMGGFGSPTKLVRAMTGTREVTLTDSEDDFEVITDHSREVVTTVLHPDRELSNWPKLIRPEKGGNWKQVIIAVDPTAKVKKTNFLESSSVTGKIKADSILMKKQKAILKGGFQRTLPVLKTIDALPLSSPLSVSPALAPPLRSSVGRSCTSNKTWRREAMPVNGQQFSSTPQKPAVAAQPSTYVRKKFSIIRYPASQVPLPSNVGAQRNALSKFPQRSATQSRNRKYSLSAPKSMGHHQVNTTIAKTAAAAAAAATSAIPNVKFPITKMSDLGTEEPSPSSVRRLHSVSDETLMTHSESLVSDLSPVLRISPSKPSHCEGSSGLTSLVCSPASKSPGRATDEAVGYVVSGTRLYRKGKSDQLYVGPSTASAPPILRTGLEKCDVPLGYIKRKTNQLVRFDHPEASTNDALENVVAGGDQVKFMNRQRKYSAQIKTKTKLGRVLRQKRGRLLGLARVWTLSNEAKHTTTALGTSRDWRYPQFPLRSDIVAPRLRRGSPLHEGKMGALFSHISNQLQKYRSAHPVYTRSADGFSLHRSGVISKSGANFKWAKFLKAQFILGSEAATKFVAEAENMKRDKKEAVAMAAGEARDGRRENLRSGSVDPSSVSSRKTLGNDGALYVRKGFGNQLVRNSKTVARAVATVKFRWSLRNARLRRAKKQGFCVYYTRFGVCKRGDGQCLFIHDPERVAVCTKFLRGCCSDPACQLTHKIIPERMSDCSFFLEGVCTNERCPYRHVNVNNEAPICEAFLQGYCADGDKCNKKHTYVCPEYALTGSCLSGICKLRHPKKAKQPASASKDCVDSENEAKRGSKRELKKGRYFTLTALAEGDHQRQPVSTAHAVVDKITELGDDLVDFISIDEYDSESSKKYQDTGTL